MWKVWCRAGAVLPIAAESRVLARRGWRGPRAQNPGGKEGKGKARH